MNHPFPIGVLVGVSVGAVLVVGWQQRWFQRRKRIYVSGCFDLLHSGHGALANHR